MVATAGLLVVAGALALAAAADDAAPPIVELELSCFEDFQCFPYEQTVGMGSEEVVLSVEDRPFSKAVAAVAAVLLEEKLGVTVSFNVSRGAVDWDALAAGDGQHVHLDVWPVEQLNKRNYISRHMNVEDAGPIGAAGFEGFWVPSYTVIPGDNDNGVDATGSIDFERLLDTEMALLFRRVFENYPRRWLAGEANAQVINEVMGEHFVPRDNTIDQLTAKVEAALSKKEPIFFAARYPDPLFDKHNLTQVKLPGYSDVCFDQFAQDRLHCDHPLAVPIKAMWPGLRFEAPLSHAFLRNLYLRTYDVQGVMLAQSIGKSYCTAACDWILEDELRWRPFLPNDGMDWSMVSSEQSPRKVNVFRILFWLGLLGVVAVLLNFCNEHRDEILGVIVGMMRVGVYFSWWALSKVFRRDHPIMVSIQVAAIMGYVWVNKLITGQSPQQGEEDPTATPKRARAPILFQKEDEGSTVSSPKSPSRRSSSTPSSSGELKLGGRRRMLEAKKKEQQM